MTDEPKPAMIIDGEPWWHFHFTYRFEGSEYAFDIPARSEHEAKERLKSIALARYDGQGHGKGIPANPATGIWVRLFTFWKNLIAK